jgi:hypothetical protein
MFKMLSLQILLKTDYCDYFKLIKRGIIIQKSCLVCEFFFYVNNASTGCSTKLDILELILNYLLLVFIARIVHFRLLVTCHYLNQILS